MPTLNRNVIRPWLAKHNWSVQRLAYECSRLGQETIPVSTLRKVVNGTAETSKRRVNLIGQVTANQGDAIPFAKLVINETSGFDISGSKQYAAELKALHDMLRRHPIRTDIDGMILRLTAYGKPVVAVDLRLASLPIIAGQLIEWRRILNHPIYGWADRASTQPDSASLSVTGRCSESNTEINVRCLSLPYEQVSELNLEPDTDDVFDLDLLDRWASNCPPS